jgi:hypothetical protein
MMIPGVGHSLVRTAAVVPVIMLVLFLGLLWLIGLFCGKERRAYVMKLSSQAMTAIGSFLHGSRQ